MINDITAAGLSNFQQKAAYVWQVTAGGQLYVVKLEKKPFPKSTGGMPDPNNRNTWENRLTDLKWATELFLEICKNDRVHPWSRALTGNEVNFLWGKLPGDTTITQDRPKTLATISDWVSDLTCFADCLKPAKAGALISLRSLLGGMGGKGDQVSLHTLGRGFALDVFLGNSDRIFCDPELPKGKVDSFVVNLDNFFLQTPKSGPNSIFYIDFWDPNSDYNSKHSFLSSYNQEEVRNKYVGPLLSKDAGRRTLIGALKSELLKVLNINTINENAIADGMKSATADLGKYLKKDKINPHIKRRLDACGIKV